MNRMSTGCEIAAAEEAIGEERQEATDHKEDDIADMRRKEGPRVESVAKRIIGPTSVPKTRRGRGKVMIMLGTPIKQMRHQKRKCSP